MKEIVLAESHEVTRLGLRTLLEKEPDFRIAGEAADGLQAVRMAHELRPDVMVLVRYAMKRGLLAMDMIQSLLDESIISHSARVNEIVVIENEFIIEEGDVRTVLFVIPLVESVETLFGSMGSVRKEYGMEWRS